MIWALGRAGMLCGAVILAAVSPAAMAAAEPYTRLVSCGVADCLLVSGHRADPRAQVLVNGHPIAVEGGKSWKAVLPLDTVRAWSRPLARSIDVNIGTDVSESQRAALPIGLLGHAKDIAFLVVGDR